jgi:hypothetical protein
VQALVLQNEEMENKLRQARGKVGFLNPCMYCGKSERTTFTYVIATAGPARESPATE